MVGPHGDLEVVLGVLALGVFEVEAQTGVVDEHVEFLAGGAKVLHELPN